MYLDFQGENTDYSVVTGTGNPEMHPGRLDAKLATTPSGFWELRIGLSRWILPLLSEPFGFRTNCPRPIEAAQDRPSGISTSFGSSDA
jgi:hypothetical protein